jgi:hypothetical protein
VSNRGIGVATVDQDDPVQVFAWDSGSSNSQFAASVTFDQGGGALVGESSDGGKMLFFDLGCDPDDAAVSERLAIPNRGISVSEAESRLYAAQSGRKLLVIQANVRLTKAATKR